MKKYKWIADYCLAKPGVEHEYKPGWDADLFKIGGKFFVLIHGDKQNITVMSVKCDPYLAQEIRQDYPGKIIPGYHLNKRHWNSIYLEETENGTEEVTMEVMKKQIDHSYELVLHKLSKIQQERILES